MSEEVRLRFDKSARQYINKRSKQNKAVESNFPKEKSLKNKENGELYG